jgi:hypothetical protein
MCAEEFDSAEVKLPFAALNFSGAIGGIESSNETVTPTWPYLQSADSIQPSRRVLDVTYDTSVKKRRTG